MDICHASVHTKLSYVQNNLVCPKAQYNSFGKYYFRNCEDILTAVKPLAKEAKCVVRLSDRLVLVGERYYIEASAIFHDLENNNEIISHGYAREESKITGMKESQITGAASSYARKYALNALLDIDDTKDTDSLESRKTPAVIKVIGQIDSQAKTLAEKGYTKAKIGSTVKSIIGKTNYNVIADKESGDKVLKALKALEETK